MKRNRIIVFTAAVLFVLQFQSPAFAKKKQWINSNIDGNILPKKPRLQDDFFQAINYEALRDVQIPPHVDRVSYGTDALEVIDKQLLSIVNADTVGESAIGTVDAEEKVLSEFYNKSINWEKRNADGIKPLLNIISKIDSVNSIAEFEEFFFDEQVRPFLLFGADLQVVSGMWHIPVFGVNLCFKDNNEVPPDFYEKMLIRCGFDEAESKRLVKLAQDFETKYSEIEVNKGELFYKNNPNPAVDGLPVVKLMEAMGVGQLSMYSLGENERLTVLASIYNQENLEAIKTLCLCRLFLKSADYLDKQVYDIVQAYRAEAKGISMFYTDEQLGLNYLKNALPKLLGKIWVKQYFPKEIKDDVTQLLECIIEEYVKQLCDWDYVSSGTGYNAAQILKKAVVLIGAQNRFDDYSTLYDEFAAIDGTGGEASLFDLYVKILNYEKKLQAKKCFETVNPDEYEIDIAPYIFNAYYNGGLNTITILAGFINGIGYTVDLSIEEKLSYLGMTIAHEMSHSFCTKEGIGFSRWKNDDYQKLQNKFEEVADYFYSFEILKGTRCKKECVYEASADLFGMSIMLKFAKQYPDFDYKYFFECYAKESLFKMHEDRFKYMISIDNHPPYYLRVNAVLQQFEEFYEAFDIKKGDGMYLAIKKRIKLF